MSENAALPLDQDVSRELPSQITIPPIKGEMVHLRPASVDDLPRMDELDAYYGASKITGKDAQAERAVVHTWVRRSVAWANGQKPDESGVGDPESRRTIAWAVMTYGFAPEPAGLGMHRIWVAVPEQNSRSCSVYQSLGFEPSGASRDALWDAENNKYQDLIVMDTLVDEYDPIRSLDAFGMHVIEDNPGVQEAMSAREHSIAIRKNIAAQAEPAPEPAAVEESADAEQEPRIEKVAAARVPEAHNDDELAAPGEGSTWPYGQSERKPSKEAWWRILGRGRKRDMEDDE